MSDPVQPVRLTFGLALHLRGADGLAGPVDPGGGETILHRETDGTVTVVSLASTFTPTLTRQVDGSVDVSG